MDLPPDKGNQSFYGTGRNASRLGQLRLPGKLSPEKFAPVKDQADEGAGGKQFDFRASALVSKDVEYTRATKVTKADMYSGLIYERGSKLENKYVNPSMDVKLSQQSDASLSSLPQIKTDSYSIYKSHPHKDKGGNAGQSGLQQIQLNTTLQREADDEQSDIECAQTHEAYENNRSAFLQSKRIAHTSMENSASLMIRDRGRDTDVYRNFDKQFNRKDASFLPKTFYAPSLDEHTEMMTGHTPSIRTTAEMENSVASPLINEDEGLLLRDNFSRKKTDHPLSASVDHRPVMEHRVITNDLPTSKVDALPSHDGLQESDLDDSGQHFESMFDLGRVQKKRNHTYESKTIHFKTSYSNDYSPKQDLNDRNEQLTYAGDLSAGKQTYIQSYPMSLPKSENSPNTDVDNSNVGLGNNGDQSVASKSQTYKPNCSSSHPELSPPEERCSVSDLDESNKQSSNNGDDPVVLQSQQCTLSYRKDISGLFPLHGSCADSDLDDSNGGLSSNVHYKAPLDNVAKAYDFPNPNSMLLLKNDRFPGIVLDGGHEHLHAKCGHTSLHSNLRHDVKQLNHKLLHSDDDFAYSESYKSENNEQLHNLNDHTCLLDKSMCTRHFEKIISASTHISESSSCSDSDSNNKNLNKAIRKQQTENQIDTQGSPSRSYTPPGLYPVDHPHGLCKGSGKFINTIDQTLDLEMEKEFPLITPNEGYSFDNTSHHLDDDNESLSITDSECLDRPGIQDDGPIFKTVISDRHSDESPEGTEYSRDSKVNLPPRKRTQSPSTRPMESERKHSSRAEHSHAKKNELSISPDDFASCRCKNYTLKALHKLIAGNYESDESGNELTCLEFSNSQQIANETELNGEDAHSKTASTGVAFKKQQTYQKLDSTQVDSLHMVKRLFHTELMLRLTAAWKDSGELHEACQERLRDNLRLMESEPAELTALFHELSVRLLSIHSDSDSIAITFNTAEELGKFTNYYSLGLVSECLKIALLSDAVWLMDPSEDQVTVQIDMNDESMRKMHLSLLLQEGRFHVRAWKSSAKASGDELALAEGEVLLVERAQGTGAWWTGRAVSSTKQGLIPRSAVEPLQHFHQWFLKSNSISDCLKHKSSLSENGKMGTGSCVATTDYKAECGDELSFKQGDHIEVEGLFIPGLHWFMGKVTSTERVGFVRMSCVRPDQITDTSVLKGAFLHRSERFHRSGLDECTAQHCYEFLSRLTGTDISTVYRICRSALLSSSHMQKHLNPVVKSMRSCSQDTKESFEFETILKLGLNDHVLENTFPHEKFKDASVAEESQLWFSVELTKCGDDSDNENWSTNSETLIQFLLFLNTPEYRREFAVLYREDSPFLYSLLRGHSDDTELVRFLELAREMAKKGGMQWAQSRTCFLLGRACSRQGKFSQARVYYEESLSMTDGDFPDMCLMAALYTNLTSMYLKVMNKEKATAMMEKTAILLVSLPGKCIGSSSAQDILKHLLSKVIFQNDLRLEGRICFLIAESLLNLNRADEALPYIERLQDLTNHFQQLSNKYTSSYYFLLNRLYATSFLRLSFGSMMRACDCDQMTITECIRCVELIVKSEGTIQNRQSRRTTMSPLCAPFLYKALQKPLEEEHKCLHNSVHNYAHLSLAELYLQQHKVKDAMCHLNKVNAVRAVSSAGEAAAAFFLKLAWMYIRVDCLSVATQILENPELGSQSAGVVHNLLGIVHARHHNIPKAATHFQSALAVAESCGEETNVAICYGNLGFLAVNAKAHLFAEICFLKAVHKYFAASNRDHEEWFNQVLVKLGQNFYTRGSPSEGLQCYEMALLIALKENDVRGQIHVTALLCQQYSSQKNDLQCIIYYEHQLNLARSSRDKRLEGDTLQILSQIYHELGKFRDYRKAVKYVKRSLAIFIDLREMERTAEAWLLAGTIYSKLGQNEIVDLHLQMAVEVALTLGQVECALHVYEAAGDVFFNSNREPEKAVGFYEDHALPLARHLGDKRRELRLCHKLSELHCQLGNPHQVTMHSTDALQLSVELGDGLSEKVTYHRLGLACVQQARFQLAEHHFLRALSLCTSCRLSHDELYYCMHGCLRLGDLASDKLTTTEDALAYYNMALLAALELGNKQLQLRLYERLASVYHNQVLDRVRSLHLYQQARALANELNVKRINLGRKPTTSIPSKQRF
ncbi:unnamed protein product [Lampetra fluviatilis]